MVRSLALAAALAMAAASPCIGKARPPIDPDPMTASGRFDLPKADGGPYAGRIRLGDVHIDSAFSDEAKLDPASLTTAVRSAAERSLKNFGYQANPAVSDSIVLDLEMLPVSTQRLERALETVVRLRFRPTADNPCLSAVGEGRFKALDRLRSGAERRAFAIVTTVALAFVFVNAGPFMAGQLSTAAEENGTLNGQREVAVAEGVSPEFSLTGQLRYGASRAIQLAFADYLRQLGSTPACKAAG